MRFLLCLVALLLSLQLSAQKKHEDRFNRIDVQHYRFELELSDAQDLIKGTATITVYFKNDSPNLDLDLVTKGEEYGMTVTAVSEGNTRYEFSHESNLLQIPVKAKADETRTFTIEYQGIPETGLVISKNKYKERTFFGDNWPDRGRHWLPLVDHPSDKATVEWVVTAPSVYKVIGNGLLQGENITANGYTITHWKTEVPTLISFISNTIN